MKQGDLLDYINGYCEKKLSVVECKMEVSNQHEFNVTKEMKKLLGNEKKHFTNSFWVYLSDYESFQANDALSWYDARENNPKRTEWRLYYAGNEVIERAEPEDHLFILKLFEEYLLLIIVKRDSYFINDLNWLLQKDESIECSSSDNANKIYEIVQKIVTKIADIEIEDDEIDAVEEANKFKIVENALVRNTMLQISFNSLILGIEQGDYIIPGFQRFYRWSEEQVENLAVSFMRGMPIPPIYCYRNKEHQLVILDGQQRILSLYLYYRGLYFKRKRNASADLRDREKSANSIPDMLLRYEMKEKKYHMKFRNDAGKIEDIDITYNNLSIEEKRQLDYFTLTIISIDIDKEQYRDAMLHKIFANLNIGGTALSNQELRNGIYYNDFYIMLFNVNSDNSKWRMLYGGSVNSKENKKSKDVELLLRMCAFWHYTNLQEADVAIDNYGDNLSIFLDDFSNVTETFDENKVNDYKKCLCDFFDCLDDASGNNKASGLVSFFVAWNLDGNKKRISEKEFRRITENSLYKKTILSHASGKTNIEKRFKYVYEEISKIG